MVATGKRPGVGATSIMSSQEQSVAKNQFQAQGHDDPRAISQPTGGTDEQSAAKRASLAPLRMLKPYILKSPAILAGALIALVVSAGAMLAVPIAVRRMIDYGFGGADGQLIDQYFMMLIVIGCVLAVASASRFYLINWLGERVVADVRADVFRHLTTLGPAFFETAHSGEMMSRLTADTTQIKAAAGTALSQLLRNAIMLVGALAMMMVTSPSLSMLVFLAIPAIVLPLVGIGRFVRKLSRKAQDELAEASAYASENLTSVRTMQAFSHQSAVADRYQVAVERTFDAARDRMKARAGLTALAILLVTSSIVGVLWFGSSSVISGEMTGGRLGQFVLYALFAAGALAELSEVWGEISQAAGAAERLAELLQAVPVISSPAHPKQLPEPAIGELEFDAVSFSYATGKAVRALEDVSFTVKRGETVAVVGPSGAGKTTLFNLILRFYDPAAGVVRIDGVDIKAAKLDAVRRRIALVPQEVALFADTVLENIRYGTPSASHADVISAAKTAQAGDFIDALTDGYETRLGERGVTLSGGQRQRLAIARAVLKDAPILLLDEATSALDAENEALVQRALDDVMKTRTTLVIAHRLSTVQGADRILVMDDGRIVEEGTHQSLLAKGGLYQRLADLQFGREAAE